MRTNRTRALLVACAALIAGGCTSSGSDDAGAELGTSTGSLAMLRLERSSSAGQASSRVVTNAKVARFSGLDGSSVLKLLGVDGREADDCTVGARLETFPLAPEAHVELLSIGDISLRLGDRLETLAPRLFPDLASTASGWFYASHAELATDGGISTADGGVSDEYALSASGADGIGRFELSVSAPGAVEGLQINGGELGKSCSARNADVALSWEPEDMRDQIEIEIYAGSSVLSCTASDDGAFTLPQAKLALLEADPQASLVVRRVRAVSTEMQGIESALVRFATTRNEVVCVQ